MLDFIKCNELLELAKEYNPILKDQSIRIIKGDEYGKLGLTYSDLRSIVREYRLGLYD